MSTPIFMSEGPGATVDQIPYWDASAQTWGPRRFLKTIWVPVTGGTARGQTNTHTGMIVDTDLDVAYVETVAPEDFLQLLNAWVAYIPLAAVADHVFTVDACFGAHLEANNVHTGTTTVLEVLTVANAIYFDDIALALVGLAAHDCVGIRFLRDNAGNTNANILGVKLTYEVKVR